ncbi:uncharacterized protein LOC108927683 [Scleropages formosus]|uniref:uncharacterized protein LOC108927683 n=1 Tax=Scleropages formosus TaxID=113540 RepID=UPI0010FA6E99|nr:uncharacterized protein LOC108927683 [Scleropages formosus]
MAALSGALLVLELWSAAVLGDVRALDAPCRGAQCPGSEALPSRPCFGTHCPAWPSRPGRHHATLAQRGHHAEPYTVVTPQRGSRARSGHASSPECAAGADCAPLHRRTANDTGDCRGIECKLPLRIRPKPRAKACVGDGCPRGSEQAGVPPALVHIPDRAAQYLGELPDFGYPGSDLGGAPLGVQLTCDVKPGENEVPSEDALVLHLQLAKGQEKLVEALQNQQTVIRELQRTLVEQQGTLISQQQEIVEQQRRMSEQMELVKVQYGVLFEAVKRASLQSLQGDVQDFFESHLQGLQDQVRTHLHKSYAVHKVDVDAKVMDVGSPILRNCGVCRQEEYCDFQRDPPRCERCTMCPPGFFLVSQCSQNADRICQDRDECLEIPNLCGERVKCLNTPGGFRCLGLSERDASAGLCGHEYFYNRELEECQACSDCEGQPIAQPCSAASDVVCGSLSENMLSHAWGAAVTLPPAGASSSHMHPGVQLHVQGKEDSDLLSTEDGRLVFLQHGLIWADHNFALKHSCRNFLQIYMKLNTSEEGVDLSGVRIEQPDGKYFQSVSMSAVAEVEPSYMLSLFLKSPNHYCNQSKDLHVYELSTPFSLFWLSHDTGAVAMTAHTSTSVQYQTNYRPAFKVMSVSDPYVVSLTHDGRGVRFTESGVVKFMFQQAVYAMGHTCVREGFSLVAYLNRNGTNSELTQTYKAGVNYRDTSVSLTAATVVGAGDTLSFEIFSPAQCNVRYFGDSSGISVLSLLWMPSAVSSCLSATVSRAGLPSGAVRNKALHFHRATPGVEQVELVGSGQLARRNFIFRESGVASVSLSLKLIHSCNALKLTLHKQGADRPQPAAVAQQVGGQMPEGTEWVSVGLRASFEVHNSTMIFVTVDCVRGRVNQIAAEGSTNISILWVAS